MAQMNSSHSSSLLLVVLCTLLVAGVAGAVNVDTETVPQSAEVGTDVSAEVALTELYESADQWTLAGESELLNVTWTVVGFNAADREVQSFRTSYAGQEFEHPVNLESEVVRIRVEITGTVPEVENYSYDPAQEILFVELSEVRSGGTTSEIVAHRTHHYTEESQRAADAIDGAEQAIDEIGGHEQAETTLANAISAYEAGNFDNAYDLARQALTTATQAGESRERNQLLLYGAIGVVLLGVVVGAVVWYRSQQQTSRL